MVVPYLPWSTGGMTGGAMFNSQIKLDVNTKMTVKSEQQLTHLRWKINSFNVSNTILCIFFFYQSFIESHLTLFYLLFQWVFCEG